MPRDIKYVGSGSKYYPGDLVYIPHCVNSPADFWKTRAGWFWMFNGLEYTDYNHNGTPNDPRPSCGGSNFGLQPPRSFHPGLVGVLFGDGHVQPVLNSIDQRVWMAMGTFSQGD